MAWSNRWRWFWVALLHPRGSRTHRARVLLVLSALVAVALPRLGHAGALELRLRTAYAHGAGPAGPGSFEQRYWVGVAELTASWDQLLFPEQFARESAASDELLGPIFVGQTAADYAAGAGNDALEAVTEGATDAPWPSTAPPAVRAPVPRHAPHGPGAAPHALAEEKHFARRVFRVALARFEDRAQPWRLSSLGTRARSSALLPELRLQARRARDESLRLAPTETDPDRFTLTGAADLWLEGRVTWQLDRLIFAREEVALWRLRQDFAKDRSKQLTAVAEVLRRWQRARALRRDVLLDPAQGLDAALDEVEAEIVLDGLTDGWFSQQPEVSGSGS